MLSVRLGLVFLFVSISGALASDPNCTRVTASAHPDYPPYHWREGGRIVGASVDLNKIVFQELSVTFDAVFTGPWKRVLKTAENGEIDFLMSLKKTGERQRFLDFTDTPAFENPFTVFTLETRRFPLAVWNDLKGRYGAKNAGDRYGEPFDAYVANVLELSDNFSFQDNVNQLLVGRIDYIIHGRYVGQAQFGAIDGGKAIVPLDWNVMNGFVHSGFTLNSACRHLKDKVSKRYGELLADGTAKRILSDNVGRWILRSRNYELKKKVVDID
ncbi:substrate-binding periplasmic protein [Roseibium sp.]|uniref:substrate-binding periplasmic protein n=1 Tax=Roseibium sp. TaxID=1936156 RepID=UPI003BAA3128